MFDRQSATRADGGYPSIDLVALGQYLRGRFWAVLAVIVLVEGMIALATGLTVGRHKAFALVQLGEVQEAGSGVQGAMLERFKAEMSNTAVGAGRVDTVTVELRPSGTVLLMAERDMPEQTLAAVEKAMKRLMQLSTEAVDRTLAARRVRIELLERSVGQLEGEIDKITVGDGTHQAQWPAMLQWSKTANLTRLLDFRNDLQGKLISARVDLAEKTFTPTVLAAPTSMSTSHRGRWLRNLGYGLAFGLPFGVLVVGLAGVIRQLGCGRP